MISLYGTANGLSGIDFPDSQAEKEANAKKTKIVVGAHSFPTKGLAAGWYPIIWPILARHVSGIEKKTKHSDGMLVIDILRNSIKLGRFGYFNVDDPTGYHMTNGVNKIVQYLHWDKAKLWSQIKYIAKSYKEGGYPYGDSKWDRGYAGYAYKESTKALKKYNALQKKYKKEDEEEKAAKAKKPPKKKKKTVTEEDVLVIAPPKPTTKKKAIGVGIVLGLVALWFLTRKKT